MEEDSMPTTRFPEDSDDEESQPSPPKRKGRGKSKKQQPEDSELRIELLSLAERGEIPHTVNHIKKATDAALEKIMVKYKQDQTEAVY